MSNDNVSKALDKSIYNEVVLLPDSISLLIWATNFTAAYSVEWLERNPNCYSANKLLLSKYSCSWLYKILSNILEMVGKREIGL